MRLALDQLTGHPSRHREALGPPDGDPGTGQAAAATDGAGRGSLRLEAGSHQVAAGDEAWLRLRDGRWVMTRPVRPDDGDALVAAYRQLSTTSKRLRFGSAPRTLGAKALRHLIDSVDGVDHVAFAAFDDAGRLVGIARILRYPDDPTTLDVGMVVADDYQGAGLGHVLSHLLAAHRPRPAKRIMTSVASDNERVMRLFRAFGAVTTWTPGGVVVELPD